jgi:hypothetical protein
MQDFRKLHAWQKSHALALRTYALTANFPKVSDVKRVVTGFLKAVATSAPDGKRQTVNGKR